jgi:hypothetical protein
MMPAVGNFVLDKGFDAAAQITKFRAVKLVAAQPDQVTPVTAITDMVVGVAQIGATTTEITKGKGVSVRLEGITEMEASAAVAIGDRVSIASDGRGKTAAATGERIIGVCMFKGAGVAGDRMSVMLDLPGMIGTTGA